MGKKVTAARHTAQYLPLFQIIGELEPAKRQLLVNHLDDASTRALSDSIGSVLKQTDVPIHNRWRKKIHRAVQSNRPAFKKLLRGRGGTEQRRQALTCVGGGPLALLLSTVIPLVLGQLIGKK